MMSWVKSSCGFLVFLLLATPSFAQDRRIQDLSLSPEDTAKQPSIRYQQNTTPITGAYGQNMYPTPSRGNYPGIPTTPSGGQYMDNYCDPNFAPAIATGAIASMQACIQQQRDTVCQAYAGLPADVKVVLNQSITCLSRLANGDADTGDIEDETVGRPVVSQNCNGSDSRRLSLMKKYWNDQTTSYALVFMPDDVLDNSSKCRRGRY